LGQPFGENSQTMSQLENEMTTMPRSMRPVKDTQQLMRVALGREAADLVVINACLLNVYSGELLEGQSVAVKGAWIAAVGNQQEMSIGPQTQIIDAAHRTVIPGLIDGHAHLSWYGCIDQFLTHMMAGGTTTVITETMEVYPVAGLEGVIDFIESCQDQPIKVFTTAPFMASISRTTHGIDPGALQNLLARSDIVGLGEAYWQSALQDADRSAENMALSLQAGKTAEGHSAGARGKKLAAYVASGISSCHEPITAEEVLARLRLGLHVMIREGSIRQDLGALIAIKDLPIDHRRLILVTDGVSPADLLGKGYLEGVVQKAIDHGVDPVHAIQMATLNVAEHFRLDNIIGGVAPGRYADLAIIPDLRTIQAQWVISRGRVIAEQGRLLVPARQHAFRQSSLNTVHLPRPMQKEDFIIHIPQGRCSATLRIIEMVTDLVTREVHQKFTTANGCIAADPAGDLVKVAAIDRRANGPKRFIGLLRGFGLRAGAVASSAAWDTADIIAVGADDEDLSLAVNRVHTLQGGLVVCERGQVLGELAMPVFGILNQQPMTAIAASVKAIAAETARLGCPFPDPLLSLVALSGAAIPFLRICEEGLVNLKDGTTNGLFVDLD
jgi:adenine deaminase